MGLLSLLCAVLSLITFELPFAKAETWVVVSETHFPPYNFNEDGKRTGMDTEIVEAVLGHIGVTPKHDSFPWNRVVNSIDHNQCDLAFQFVGKPERFKKYHMVGPHRSGLTVFAVRADSTITYENLEDLTGKTVGIVGGYSYTPEFDQAGFLRKDPARDNLLNLRKLAAGRVDLAIGDLHTMAFFAKKAGIAKRIRFLPNPLKEVPRYIAFPKRRGENAARFGKALEELMADGTIKAIIDRWQQL